MTTRVDRLALGGFLLLGLAILIAIVALSIGFGSSAPLPRKPVPIARSLPGKRIVPTTAPPPVEPIEYADMSADEARAFNATVPLVAGRLVPAPPFRFAGDPADRARATACLAAAVLFEAGDDPAGEAAVAQVVLNRLRHPAFPKTVCGVVFQGSERHTGCQFTFTCDGALARTPAPAAWARATAIAAHALDGRVVKEVGTATHYHADYVVPYWGPSLAKIAVVAPHIFYRWPGRWGLPASFVAAGRGSESIDPRVAAFAGLVPGTAPFVPRDDDGAPLPQPPLQQHFVTGVPESALHGAVVRLKDEEAGQYILQLNPSANPGSYAVLGFTICTRKPDCIVMGWTSVDEVPRAFPITPIALRSLAFLYRRSSILQTAAPYWDCRRFHRSLAAQCLPGTGK
ncbi:cell wall hydrolase [Sphingomonas sp. AP4-R1]|uniref:cell wall hydrolase n=1 Tax=Sphingomonas sp. AP4-R1 TaxID=2735134 RepID=UPI0014935FE5|nr:cell wall hydrolase [Sphingomonas sp. AP4-R1]QJU58575.1 cell wall hydrolase [Sphingomonas sp. AP4-R1]